MRRRVISIAVFVVIATACGGSVEESIEEGTVTTAGTTTTVAPVDTNTQANNHGGNDHDHRGHHYHTRGDDRP